MAIAKEVSENLSYNPLNEFEDLLESSGYDYDRVTKTRLHFDCDGKQGKYGIMLEWNEDAKIIKCSLIIGATKVLPKELLENCINQINESAWYGFFILDGVGNSIYKSLIQYDTLSIEETLIALENAIDGAIKEGDRFSISLALSNDNEKTPSLFQADDEWSLENLSLMFSEIKGNA